MVFEIFALVFFNLVEYFAIVSEIPRELFFVTNINLVLCPYYLPVLHYTDFIVFFLLEYFIVSALFQILFSFVKIVFFFTSVDKLDKRRLSLWRWTWHNFSFFCCKCRVGTAVYCGAVLVSHDSLVHSNPNAILKTQKAKKTRWN